MNKDGKDTQVEKFASFFKVFLPINFHHFLPRILAIQNGDMFPPPPEPCFPCNPSLVLKVMRDWQDGVASWWSQNQLQNRELCLRNDPHITQSESILQTKWRDLFQNGQVATGFKLGQLKGERSVILCDEELLGECEEGAHNMPHACGASSHCGICLCKSKLPCSNESKQTFKPRHVWYTDI